MDFAAFSNISGRKPGLLWGTKMTKIIRKEIRKRGIFGRLCKWLFIAFNLGMAAWLVAYFKLVGDLFTAQSTQAARAGATVGGMIGTTVILWFWALGDFILGLLAFFTRGRLTIIEERVE
jgi:hypothetical protein